MRNISSVQTAGSSGNRSQNLTVRGFAAGRFAKDGFLAPASFGDTGLNDLANVARVEVLKGPASILYGQTEPGGLVHIVTKKPQADAFYDLEVAGGSDAFKRGAADLNQPISDALGVRFNLAYQDKDGFRDHFIDDERSLAHGALRWAPGTQTTIDFQIEYFDQERQFDRGLVAPGDDADALPRDRFLGERFSRFETDGIRTQLVVEQRFNDTWSLHTMARYSDNHADRFSADPRGLRADGRTLIRRVADLEQDIENVGFQTNLKGEFDGEWIDHELLVGVDFNQTDFDATFRTAPLAGIDILNPEFGAQPGQFGDISPQVRNVDFAGIYLQDLVSVGERWHILLGGRFEQADTQFAIGEGLPILNDATDEEFSPRLGVIFKPRPDTSLYASYSTSFDPFVFNVEEPLQPFEPEEGEQIELGLKKEWFDGDLLTTIAGFELTKENVLTPDPNDIDRTLQTGEQRSRGIEADITGQISDQWRVIATASYLDAEVTEDNRIEEGNRLNNAPEWSGSIWTVYDFAVEPLHGLSLGGGFFYVGERTGDIANTFEADRYTRVDLFARYQFTERLSAKLNVDNVFDNDFIQDASSRGEITPGAPVQAFARLNYRL